MYIQGLAAVKRKAEGVAKGKAKKPKVEPGVSTKTEEDDPPADCAEDHMLKMLVINAFFSQHVTQQKSRTGMKMVMIHMAMTQMTCNKRLQ